ncbi:MAG: 50S ribosomal protein L17 [Kiritimatiellae bacterium]|nr:50S ribosomal protein L17 [Kiritimatiellia bacterium]
MRHRKRTVKLGRTSEHRRSMLANQVCSLIESKRITTTLAKARATRSLAEKMVTLGKQETLAARRRAISVLHNKTAVAELFSSVAPAMKDRAGGYTRIMKLGPRSSDGSEMAILEWVDYIPVARKKAAKGDAPEAGASEEKS